MLRPNQLAYEYIKTRIENGTYRPAERLVEAQLANDIQVSRNTVKKALLQLAQDKLIVIEDNKGATVIAPTVDKIQEYYEIRKALEIIVVSAAIDNITEVELDQMSSMLTKMEDLKNKQDFDNYSKCNKEFHNIIYQISKKEVAIGMIKEIKNQLFRFQFRTMLAPGRSEQSIQEHKTLLDAFIKKDKELACKAISEHMEHVLETIIKYKALFF